ncbi:MAG: hypothetical protein J1F38_08780 [Muribaculaceae bacterium]|nr:hypothetical protein [Muribaculaceae bacterium]
MEENRNKFTNPSVKYSNWGFMWEGFESFLISIVKETIEEVLQNKMYENVSNDKILSAKQLRERWLGISDTTLLTWEKQGKISPLQISGRKKMYSMREIREAEASFGIKHVG